MLRLSFAKRHCFTLAGAFVATSTFLLVLVSHGQQEPTHLGLPQRSQLDTTTQAQRRSLLESKCAHYMHDPGSPRSLRGEGDSSRRLGTEVVYLLSGGPGPNASVCVPHKASFIFVRTIFGPKIKMTTFAQAHSHTLTNGTRHHEYSQARADFCQCQEFGFYFL